MNELVRKAWFDSVATEQRIVSASLSAINHGLQGDACGDERIRTIIADYWAAERDDPDALADGAYLPRGEQTDAHIVYAMRMDESDGYLRLANIVFPERFHQGWPRQLAPYDDDDIELPEVLDASWWRLERCRRDAAEPDPTPAALRDLREIECAVAALLLMADDYGVS